MTKVMTFFAQDFFCACLFFGNLFISALSAFFSEGKAEKIN
jgi:hypothetical protein